MPLNHPSKKAKSTATMPRKPSQKSSTKHHVQYIQVHEKTMGTKTFSSLYEVQRSSTESYTTLHIQKYCLQVRRLNGLGSNSSTHGYFRQIMPTDVVLYFS